VNELRFCILLSPFMEPPLRPIELTAKYF